MTDSWSRKGLRQYEGALAVLLRIADVLVCLGAGLLAFVARFGQRDLPDAYQIALAVAVLLVLALFPLWRVYRTFRTRSIALPSTRVVVAWVSVMVSLLVLIVVAGSGGRFSRAWIAIWFGVGTVGLVGLRLVAYAGLRLLRRSGRNVKRIVLVGAGPLAEELRQRVAREKWMGFEIVSHCTDQLGYSPLGKGRGEPSPPGLAGMIEGELVKHQVDEVWIATSLDQGDLVREVFEAVKPYAITVRYAPDFRQLFLLNHGITEMAGLPMIDLTAGPLQGANGVLKRVEDSFLAFVLFVLFLPLMLVIAAAVKFTSPGPVIFKQRRHGWDGRVIKVYKFRTMRVHEEYGTIAQATRDDERITRLGHFLRHTSLDELPQLFNVLQGRMSLVGPRPHACQHNELYQARIEGYMLRHKMRPGITGWAQVNGLRGETETLDKMKGRIEHDLFYIEHWSLWLDLKILALTLVYGFVNSHAY